MANLGHKNGVYHVRFRYQQKEYKKSLKTHDKDDAAAAVKGIEQIIHLLAIGQKQIPEGTDPGDFIAGGGIVRAPRRATRIDQIPNLEEAVGQYLENQQGRAADTYLDSQRTHLKHLKTFLNGKTSVPCSRISFIQLDRFLQVRRRTKDAGTVNKERNTLRKFFAWCQDRQYIVSSPADLLKPIPCGREMDKFRTKTEIENIIQRGGLTDEQVRVHWECLYLAMEEIGDLLALVRQSSKYDTSYLLHAIPAFTGMRRGEVLRLRWVDLDLERKIITAYSRKQSRSQEWTSRDIDLHDDLRRELLSWRKQRPEGQFVLSDAASLEPLTNDTANRNFWQPMRRTEWCLHRTKNWFKIGFHSYRHSFASNLAALAVDQRIIDRFMGHQTEIMRRRYQHLRPEERRSAVDQLSYGRTKTDPATAIN